MDILVSGINEQGEKNSDGLFTTSTEQEYTTAFIRSSIPIGVIIELAGGSEQPTGSRVLVVEL